MAHGKIGPRAFIAMVSMTAGTLTMAGESLLVTERDPSQVMGHMMIGTAIGYVGCVIAIIVYRLWKKKRRAHTN